MPCERVPRRMATMRSTTLIAVLAATATLGAAAAADAYPICVGDHADCPKAAPHMQLQSALDYADFLEGDDTIFVGPGTFTTDEGFKFETQSATSAVEIIGSGDATVLTADTAAKPDEFRVLDVTAAAPSRITRLKIVAPDVDGQGATMGLYLREHVVAEDVTVTDRGNGADAARFGVVTGGGELRRATVAMNGQAAAAVRVLGGALTVADSSLRAAAGLVAYQGGAVTIRRSVLEGRTSGATIQSGGTLDIESSVVRLTQDGSTGLVANGGVTGVTTLDASHVTLIGGSPGKSTTAVRSKTQNDGDVVASIDNSIMHGFKRGFDRASTDQGGQGEAKVVGRSLNYDATFDADNGPGQLDVDDVTTLDPGFVDAAKGDFRITPKSAMIGLGRAESFVALTDQDLARGKRSVGPARDLGAFEYQALAPVAVIGAPAATEVGKPAAYSGAESHDGDAGDALVSWEWSFSDGGKASGREVDHTWSAAGMQTVELTVTDTTGRTHTATKAVHVDGPVDHPPLCLCSPVYDDKTPPVISGLKRRGRRLAFSLSEPATVTIALQKRDRRRLLRPSGAVVKVTGQRGANGVRLRKLRAGRYRLVVVATDAAGNRGTQRLTFRIRPRIRR